MIITRPSIFIKNYKKLDNSQKIPAAKQIKKIINNPTVGKTMRGDRKGTRELYLDSFRLSYMYDPIKDEVTFLSIYHKKNQSLSK